MYIHINILSTWKAHIFVFAFLNSPNFSGRSILIITNARQLHAKKENININLL